MAKKLTRHCLGCYELIDEKKVHIRIESPIAFKLYGTREYLYHVICYRKKQDWKAMRVYRERLRGMFR